MAKKFLLTRFTTVRDGERVTFPANKTADLTKDELALLTKIEKSTGRAQFRAPVNEQPVEDDDDGEGGDGEAFLGEAVAMDKKTVPQLQAYLTHNKVEFASGDDKATLFKAASVHQADAGL